MPVAKDPTRSSFFLTSIMLLVAGGILWVTTREMRSHQTNHFSNEILSTQFMSYATTISAQKRLNLAQLRQVEIFDRKSEAAILWNYVQLPDVVVRASVPVEYNYYVDLNDKWQFNRQNKTLLIIAPALKAATPAADISNLNFEVRQGSFFRNEQQVATGLHKELTALLAKRALHNQHLVKEIARKELIKTVQDWFGSDSGISIEVQFSDETNLDMSN